MARQQVNVHFCFAVCLAVYALAFVNYISDFFSSSIYFVAYCLPLNAVCMPYFQRHPQVYKVFFFSPQIFIIIYDVLNNARHARFFRFIFFFDFFLGFFS